MKTGTGLTCGSTVLHLLEGGRAVRDADLRTWIVDFRTILFQHQRADGQHCLCGYRDVLVPHYNHQADMLQKRLGEIEDEIAARR
jgi:hypothetical protein